MEENNQSSPTSPTELPSSPVEPTQNVGGDVPEHFQVPKKPTSKKKWLVPVIAVVFLVAFGAGAWFFLKDDKPDSNDNSNISATIDSYQACVNAGYPVMESSPEQCSVPGGKTFTNTAKLEDSAQVEEVVDSTPKCTTDDTLFADKDFGAAFCYPTEWGTASVMDAKVDTADTGHREAVRFSANTKFIVGGTSEDWSTTVGRGVACQEPNNVVPELSSYNTDWHDISGEGMAVEFATRSVESSEGGYDITETVSNMLEVGVCVQGHKIIDGSRYRVLFEAFFTDFSESAGISSPKAHMDNPNILFTDVERMQFDSLLASAVSY